MPFSALSPLYLGKAWKSEKMALGEESKLKLPQASAHQAEAALGTPPARFEANGDSSLQSGERKKKEWLSFLLAKKKKKQKKKQNKTLL